MRRLIVVLVVAAVGVGIVVWRSGSSDTTAAAQDGPALLATSTVRREDVTTYDETTATLGFTTSVTVASPVAGTVTSIVSSGDEVHAGDVLATVDAAPVVALIGDVPGWRDLSTSSSDGVDIRQLETNLVALGFDPDGEIVIDAAFDSATAAAVELWEDSLGIDADGTVDQGQIVFVPGDLLVDEVSASVGRGATSGGALVTARVAQRRFPVVGRADAFVSSLARPGSEVATGTVLMRADGLPVAAIEGDVSSIAVLDRELEVGVEPGHDVRMFEQMLADAGFDADGYMVVDDTYDLATAVAVLAWWQSIDPAIVVAPEDLVVPVGSFVIVPPGLVAGGAAVDDGTTLTTDATVLDLTSTPRVVSTTAPVGDDTFAVGAVVDVEFSDGAVSPGTVVSVGTTATNPTGTVGETPTVDITISVEDIPDSVRSFVSIPVTLRVVDQQIVDAFVVPASALVALAEGGYAVEVLDEQATSTTAARTHLVAVETGLFTDGDVVVTGTDLVDGMTIVVPS